MKNSDPIKFEQLISKINTFEVILIPVFHGNKENHENALHIYLPSSKTTWIYLNLDSNIHDFKFWMAHELGHALSPSLSGDTAEDFADAFAQALLFPEDQSAAAYAKITKTKSKNIRINKIIEISKVLMISPVTVYKAINGYAEEKRLPALPLEPEIYPATANLNKTFANVSMNLCKESSPSAAKYLDITKTIFHSPFFDILRAYFSENENSAGFIQSILDTSILDAKAIHAELVG
ncbi:MAG: ImmA/IrrE family metallo-endopeptidase [Proteobacteria bacterium]|nr:ImmA/IrrE family metallo-endopeptidase [Pseudomonadota bacterium]MBU4470597.1 ImmA/IrrE family metallo-endopeptidase [Pseudomonadota bacterium]MCG2753322.1 ImmA/IrrE family metallo-endopeptidase [Desulfobacteraceae bacterium]